MAAQNLGYQIAFLPGEKLAQALSRTPRLMLNDALNATFRAATRRDAIPSPRAMSAIIVDVRTCR